LNGPISSSDPAASVTPGLPGTHSAKFSLTWDLLTTAVVVVLVCLAVYHGRHAIGNTKWPYDPDAFRDIAQAQVILDGEYPADYFYQGAWTWYHPLTAFFIAATSTMANLSPNVADMRLGLYLNALVPLAFFALARRFFGRDVALIAVISFLFIVPLDRPGWTVASYSPWLFAPHITQAFFYFSLWLLLRAFERRSYARWSAAGLALGVTFLGHAAPALVLGGTATILFLVEARYSVATTTARIALAKFYAVFLASAFFASLPFTVSILFRYGLHIKNPIPTTWVDMPLGLESLGTLLLSLASLVLVVQIVGFVALIQSKSIRERRLVFVWFFVTLGFLGYSYLAQAASRAGIRLPQFMPGYHFVIYLAAAGHLFFGVGVVAIARVAAHLLSYLRSGPEVHARRILVESVIVGVLALVTFVFTYERYPSWQELQMRSANLSEWLENKDNPIHWIQQNGSPSDVFVCDDLFAMHVVSPGGCRVLCGDPFFSNLYCDWESRRDARDAFWAALEAGDIAIVDRAARDFNIRYALIAHERTGEFSPALSRCAQRVFVSDIAEIWELERMEVQ
jgi:hypothetical protein